MSSRFESNCMLTLAACVVSWIGLFMLNDQCSIAGMVISLVGLAGIGGGIRGIVGTIAPRIASKWHRPFVAPVTS